MKDLLQILVSIERNIYVFCATITENKACKQFYYKMHLKKLRGKIDEAMCDGSKLKTYVAYWKNKK